MHASMDSVVSKGSSAGARSGRSSFAAEAAAAPSAQDGPEVDAYGRPSFAAFDASAAAKARGAWLLAACVLLC
jgi:hypothetical protein